MSTTPPRQTNTATAPGAPRRSRRRRLQTPPRPTNTTTAPGAPRRPTRGENDENRRSNSNDDDEKAIKERNARLNEGLATEAGEQDKKPLYNPSGLRF
jgi:hypothetical protein